MENRFFRLRYSSDEDCYHCELADLTGRTLFSLPVPQCGNHDVERLLNCPAENFSDEVYRFLDSACDWRGCSVREILYTSLTAILAICSSRAGLEAACELFEFAAQSNEKLGLAALA